ncbi:MAG TPA: thiamine pyrophosphate-dependent enzyme, partial [Kofleriaceae bacterium]|nr:thiamine pyrophosphate-dependent enzyme [Kofleriaceae bacterium]
MHLQDDLRRVLDEEGRVIKGAKVPPVPDEDLMRIFECMLLVRVMDDRMMKIQRQGRLGFYMQSLGEEACHFAVYPLRKTDWAFPSYREQGAWFWAGYTVENYIDQLLGNEMDPVKGRQMPVHHSASWLNYVSISSPVGTQIPQAVGTAMGMKISKTDGVAMTFFGEGTSSTGEFHVGMNFAGVSKAPVVFVCRNNGYAISVPIEKQTAAKTFASKAVGYGMPGVRVDGNDILAVLDVSIEAVERARAGEGPTMIEAITYRREGHSSSDDPSVYRDPREPVPWHKKDPVNRLR